jgi:L-fuconolactonase
MLIVDSQIHIWQNGKMSPHHRQNPTYSMDDALAEMATGDVECAVIHPPSSLGDAVNDYAVEAVHRYPDRFCILGQFDLQSPNRENIVAHWRERAGMLGFRFTFNQPHEKSWWTDGSLDWFWKACEKHGLAVGLLASGANIAAFGRIAERHPGLRMHIDHIGRGGGRAELKAESETTTMPGRSCASASGENPRLPSVPGRQRTSRAHQITPSAARSAISRDDIPSSSP